ncbi:DMT family transporter [bacterium]|nr:DMT family transporter [bacterium]
MKSVIENSKPSRLPSNRLADACLLLVAFIWGINMAVMKMGITMIDPFAFNSVRLTLSAMTLGVCVWLEKRRQTSEPSPPLRPHSARSATKKWAVVIAFGLLSGGFYQIVFAIGMDRTTAGDSALIMSSIPMWTALLAFIFLHENLKKIWIGLIITFVGTLVVTLQSGGFDFSNENLIGNSIILIAALAWSTGVIISRPLMKTISPIQLAFYATLGTLPIHYLMAWLFETNGFQHLNQPAILFCIGYSGIFSTGLAYAMWNYGVHKLGASHASVFQNLVPLVALAAAWISPLNEKITAIQILGGFLIIFGLLVTQKLRTPSDQTQGNKLQRKPKIRK